jgi:hypothetical protein
MSVITEMCDEFLTACYNVSVFYTSKVVLWQKILDTDSCIGDNAGEYVDCLTNGWKCSLS